MGLAITLLISSISAVMIAQKTYAAEADKVGSPIKVRNEKIALERDAIIADGRRLQEAKKTGDKAKIEKVKQETDQDIKKRRAVIRGLYKGADRNMVNKNDSGKKKKKGLGER